MPSKLDKYTLLRTLGQGAYSKVKLGLRKDTGEYFALKVHKRNDPNFTQESRTIVMSEVKSIIQLKHPNIINIVEYIDEAEVEKEDGRKVPVVCVIVEEIAGGGELFYYISNSGYFSEKFARYFFHQLMSGLSYMHAQGMAHRDLKPDNILFDDNFNIKIADFGFAGPMAGRDGSGYLKTVLGTKPYMAPEINE